MKNKQKIFNIYLVTILIAVILIVGGIYIFNKNKVTNIEINNKILIGATTTPRSANTYIPFVINLKPGDISGNMKLLSIKPFKESYSALASNNVIAEFSGDIEVEGIYKYSFSEFDGDWKLSFTPSADNTSLPFIGKRSTRTFYFINQFAAEKFLKITPNVESSGTAVIEIRDYTLVSYPSEVEDRTTIISVK